MPSMNVVPVSPGDVVTLRKPHPCGGVEWTIARVGADIGLKCCTCGRRVLLAREEFERRLKRTAGPLGGSRTAVARERGC